ncbi:hypothetical protein MRX96_014409 [Rhipicephalus microplus]
MFPYWRARAMGEQVPKSALRTPLQLAMDLAAIAHPASGDALPLSRGGPTSALRAAWIQKSVLYHLRCAIAKLEWRIPQQPLQSDYRRLQAQWDIAAPAADLTAIANPASCNALPLSRGLPTSALRAAWIPRCVLYHLPCANAKLEWRIPQPPLQSDYRQLQAQDVTAIGRPASGDALPLSPVLPTSALRAAWIQKCVLYHLRCANAKLEWRILQPPQQSDYRRLQAHSGILLLQRLASRRGGVRGGQVRGVSRCRFKLINFEGRATHLKMARHCSPTTGACRLPVGSCSSSGKQLVVAVLKLAKMEECRAVASSSSISKAGPLSYRWLESEGFSQMSAGRLLGSLTRLDARDAPLSKSEMPKRAPPIPAVALTQTAVEPPLQSEYWRLQAPSGILLLERQATRRGGAQAGQDGGVSRCRFKFIYFEGRATQLQMA